MITVTIYDESGGIKRGEANIPPVDVLWGRVEELLSTLEDGERYTVTSNPSRVLIESGIGWDGKPWGTVTFTAAGKGRRIFFPRRRA